MKRMKRSINWFTLPSNTLGLEAWKRRRYGDRQYGVWIPDYSGTTIGALESYDTGIPLCVLSVLCGLVIGLSLRIWF